MATAIVDLDGTIFQHGTNGYLPGARERLRAFQDAGHQIIFITNRKEWYPGGLGSRGLKKFLQKDFPGCGLIMEVSSPRVLINDQGAIAINHKTNAPFRHDLLNAIGD